MADQDVPKGLLTFEENARPFALIDGRIVERRSGTVTVELFSGVKFEIRETGIIRIQEYEDPVTHQGMVQIALSEDTPITALIEPRMLRIARETNVLPLGFEAMLTGHLAPRGHKLTEGRLSDSPTRCAYNTNTYCSPFYPAYVVDDSTYDIGTIDD